MKGYKQLSSSGIWYCATWWERFLRHQTRTTWERSSRGLWKRTRKTRKESSETLRVLL